MKVDDIKTEDLQGLQQEKAILEVTEHIIKIMKQTKTTKEQLAKKLDIHVMRLNRILNGDIKLDVKMISDILTALGQQLIIGSRPLS